MTDWKRKELKRELNKALDDLMDTYLDREAFLLMDRDLERVKETYPHHRYYKMELVRESDLYNENSNIC